MLSLDVKSEVSFSKKTNKNNVIGAFESFPQSAILSQNDKVTIIIS